MTCERSPADDQAFVLCGLAYSEFATVLPDSNGVTASEVLASESIEKLSHKKKKQHPLGAERTRQACETCYTYKGRCCPSKVAGICERCFDKKACCIPHQPRIRVRKQRRGLSLGKNSDGDSLAGIEKKIEWLCVLLERQNHNRSESSGFDDGPNLRRTAHLKARTDMENQGVWTQDSASTANHPS